MALTRRDFLRSATVVTAGALTGVAAYGVAYERHRLDRIVRDIVVRGLPPALDGLRIGMITDVHHSSVVPADDVARAVAALAEAAPDIIVLGGDYVSFFDRRYIGAVAELLAPLAHAPHGSFAVLGNHDDEREMPAALTARGFTVLKDQRTALMIRGEQLDLAGIHFWTRSPAEVASVLKGTGGTTILLAHDPRRLTEAAALDVQLVLSGHTHGGQLFPMHYLTGLVQPYLAGLHRRGDSMIYVSRGTGYWGPPLRLGAPPEITLLRLTVAR